MSTTLVPEIRWSEWFIHTALDDIGYYRPNSRYEHTTNFSSLDHPRAFTGGVEYIFAQLAWHPLPQPYKTARNRNLSILQDILEDIARTSTDWPVTIASVHAREIRDNTNRYESFWMGCMLAITSVREHLDRMADEGFQVMVDDLEASVCYHFLVIQAALRGKCVCGVLGWFTLKNFWVKSRVWLVGDVYEDGDDEDQAAVGRGEQVLQP